LQAQECSGRGADKHIATREREREREERIERRERGEREERREREERCREGRVTAAERGSRDHHHHQKQHQHNKHSRSREDRPCCWWPVPLAGSVVAGQRCWPIRE
jgi:hypothetical protein